MSDRTPDPAPGGPGPGRWRAPAAAAAAAIGGAVLWGAVGFAVPEGRFLFLVAALATTAFAATACHLAVRFADAAERGAAERDRAQRELRAAREERDAALERVESGRRDLDDLASRVLPGAVARLRDGATAPPVLSETPAPGDEDHRRLLELLVREIAVGERRRAAALAACANAAGRVQAMSTRTLAELRDMQDRCDPDMLGDLMRVDHNTSQVGRVADSIAVLTGARTGRRWTKPIRMESILRGAMGRISAYRRVRLHSSSRSAVAGYAAEDVMHALAELMDNGTRFSAPTEEVHVYVEDLNNGAVFTVEDAGLGMRPQALTRAELAVSRTEPLDLTRLSGSRLGLAVVGQLARKHRMNVFFRPSSRGGVGVVLRLPNHLLTSAREDPLPAPVRNGSPAPGQAAPDVRPLRAAPADAPTDAPAAPPADAPVGTAPEPTAPEPAAPEPIAPAPAPEPAEPHPAAPAGDTGTGPAPGAAPKRPLPKRPRGDSLRSDPDISAGSRSAPAAPTPALPASDGGREPRAGLGSRFGAFQQSRPRNHRSGDTGPLPLRPSTPRKDEDAERGG
ncbi:ATP-binding protein [Nocardiopsis suaedae]|uniref:histidine kinase n=1 Tax=Nocardiopsis suaedae TaxID=3018444 RepID=A0ABT4TKN0_9ACTN|nr:ATP-binding protein [Nocardiopsis suaedae]MDA2805256.1 ATP-binding protein [Nocardiopsis suaedae]